MCQENLRDDYKWKLSNTHLYILISSYKQAKKYGKGIVRCMEANARRLMELGVTPHIIVRCDGVPGGGVTEDVALYAKFLKEQNLSFKCHESKSVKTEALTFEGNDPKNAHWELVANEWNFGCSGTRHASIDMIEDDAWGLVDVSNRSYIAIFDGDDLVHEDFYPVLLLNALYANKRVSNYNGRMGAHGLENIWLRIKRMLGIGEEYKWTIYTDMVHDCVEETFGKRCGRSGDGACCTTKLFEANYLYQRLNHLWEEKRKENPKAERDWIDLTELSPLDGFGCCVCTCTTSVESESLFHYTQH